MRATVNVRAGTPDSADARREKPNLWTMALVLGVIAACLMGASIYVQAPLLDAGMIGP